MCRLVMYVKHRKISENFIPLYDGDISACKWSENLLCEDINIL